MRDNRRWLRHAPAWAQASDAGPVCKLEISQHLSPSARACLVTGARAYVDSLLKLLEDHNAPVADGGDTPLPLTHKFCSF